MKRILILCLAVVFALCMMTGCAKEEHVFIETAPPEELTGYRLLVNMAGRDNGKNQV